MWFSSGRVSQKSGVVFGLGFTLLVAIPFAFRQVGSDNSIVKESLLLLNFDGVKEKSDVNVNVQKVSVRNRLSRQHLETRKADGSFNGFPIYYNDGSDGPLHSTVHCVGENHNEKENNSWMYRSCEFRHLCFDVAAKQYVIYRSPLEKALNQRLASRTDTFVSVSTLANVNVSIGGINPRWNEDSERLRWFPKIEEEPLAVGFYELPSDVVLIPFHSLAGFNAGHMMWDDFLPIHTLLSIFGFEDKRLMLMRYVLEEKLVLWATCEFEPQKNVPKCNTLFKKFLPALGVDPITFRTTNDSQFNTTAAAKSNLVCAKYGAAGMGMIQDHGLKLHGWVQADYKTTYNMGRAGPFYTFRNFMLQNLGLSTAPLSSAPPFNITFSIHSSNSFYRSKSFEAQSKAVKEAFKEGVNVGSHVMSKLSAYEQARITIGTAVFVTVSGGGAATATFLPRGSSLILYYDERGSMNEKNPARLDWDLLNNIYIRTHWLPLRVCEKQDEIETMVQIIANDLDVIKRHE